MTLNFVLLTKCYDIHDFKYWYDYHKKRFPKAEIFVFDNDSLVNIADLVPKDRYFRIAGFPNQKVLYADIMMDKYGKLFNENDAVCFIDDDEFIYMNDPNADGHDIDLCKVLDAGFREYDTLVLPHINMSTKELEADRDTSVPLPYSHCYHRPDISATVKCFVRYVHAQYDWRVQRDIDMAAHVPFVNGKRNAAVFTCWFDKKIGASKGLYFPIGNTSFAQIDYNSNIRLYHYHLKSRWDWDEKIKRGSCACVVPWYSAKVEENSFYGRYEIFDSSMADAFHDLIDFVQRKDGKLHDEYQPIQENETTKRREAFLETHNYDLLDDKDPVDYETIRFARDKISQGIRWIHQNMEGVDVYNPKTLVDWINYYKFWDVNPRKITWADKIAVYKELYDLGLENIRIPVLYERYKPSTDEIHHAIWLGSRSDSILKCNHASGYNIRFKAGEPVNYDFLTKKIQKWLDTNYAYIAGYEWHYETIVPGIILQPALFTENPIDYQFWCEDGEILAIELQKKVSKVIVEHIAFTDKDGNDSPWYIGSAPLQRGLNAQQMEAVKAMTPVVKKIAKLFKFVRVDLFWVNKRIYFCETTFCPCSGVLEYTKKV